ncbi:MAG: HD domain-containing phosphohydrolase [Pseudomonadota bacterium]
MPEPTSPYRYIAELLPHTDVLAAVYGRTLGLVAPAGLADVLRNVSLSRRQEGLTVEEEQSRALAFACRALLEELDAPGRQSRLAHALQPPIRSSLLRHLPTRREDLPDAPLPERERLMLGALSRGFRQAEPAGFEEPLLSDGPALEQVSARLFASIDKPLTIGPHSLAEVFWHFLALKNWTTAAHCVRVADLCLALGIRRSLSNANCETLLAAGLLHDVGKLGVASLLLDKEGDLAPPERSEMRAHARMGEELLAAFPPLEAAAVIVGRHHEKCDGSGYPNGLSGAEIDPLSRILTVADVYDALAYERPYRAALDPESIFAIMRHDMATALDQSVVSDLHAILAEESLAS